MHIREKYTLETEAYRSPGQGKGSWNQTKCSVMETQPDGTKKKIGEFIRNYHSIMETWEPFEQDGKAYALCSPHYTGTSVMALPECEIIAAEPKSSWGFCPTGFYVPDEMHYEPGGESEGPIPERWAGKFGFVCGCVWGDDTSWKIQFLDLSEIRSGKITRDDRFGYVELPGGASNLKKYAYLTAYKDEMCIRVVGEKTFWGGIKLTTGDPEDEDSEDINEIASDTRDIIMNLFQREKKKPMWEDTLSAAVRDLIFQALTRVNE